MNLIEIIFYTPLIVFYPIVIISEFYFTCKFIYNVKKDLNITNIGILCVILFIMDWKIKRMIEGVFL